jgi:hypothetical protein
VRSIIRESCMLPVMIRGPCRRWKSLVILGGLLAVCPATAWGQERSPLRPPVALPTDDGPDATPPGATAAGQGDPGTFGSAGTESSEEVRASGGGSPPAAGGGSKASGGDPTTTGRARGSSARAEPFSRRSARKAWKGSWPSAWTAATARAGAIGSRSNPG